MEANLRWAVLTSLAPIAWGSTYYITREFLPADYPLYGAALRALPAGMLLLLVSRRLPRGSWWWRSVVLGALNMSAFFALVYLAAQLLPTSVASVIMASSPVAMMVIAWALLSERPPGLHLIGACLGIVGVCTMMLTGAERLDMRGVLASLAAMSMSSLGYVLAKRWTTATPVVATTSWQLIAGGLLLIPLAVTVEGSPPSLTARELASFAYVSVVATALAFAAWFTGLRHLPAGRVGLIGLLNPVTGVLLGTVVAAETLTLQQAGGIALVLIGIALGQHRRS
ncbi:MAG: EamA family transporter [Trueperaceae bacterium]|nr:EamA family transporter [Trueperaceae bacterium]